MISPIVERLFAAIARHPGHPAVVQGGKQTSYRDFGELVRAFAARFAETSQAPRVAICAEQSAEAYAAMFGAMQAGGFYAPLNAEAGQARLRTALEEIEPDIVVLSPQTAGIAATLGYAGPTLLTPELTGKAPGAGVIRQAHRLAYVMFTSGSTGRPKGVMISQDALAHYASWALRAMDVTPQDRWSQHPNIGFDLSVLDIYGALLGGATLFPLNDPLDRLLPARAIHKHKLTIWNSVPSVMGMMMKSGDWKQSNAASLRLLTFCGEPLLAEHVAGIFSVLPDVPVHNTYGPTEATVSCSLIKLTRENFRKHAKASMALGDPIPGTVFHIDGVRTADLETGELLIAGRQLADGYWNDPAKTANAFKTVNRDGRAFIAYQTGDFVQRDGSGLFFTERLDNQVKIKGHRIELNEISSQIRKLGYVHAETIADGQSIIALVEGEAGEAALARLREHLARELEAYMQPARIVFLPGFPRNANDKIDLAALRAVWDSERRSSSAEP